MNLISIIVGGLAASAMALEYADLAPCGQTCIGNMFAQAYNMDCPPYPNGRPNLNCLCNDANFFNGIRDCAFAACNALDAENTLGLAAIYCTDPKYKSPNYPCPPALVLPGTDVGSTSGSGSGGSTNSNSNSNSDGTNNNNDNNNANGNNNGNNGNNGLPRVDVLTYFSNGNTYIATVTVSPAADNNNGVAVSSQNGGGGGGLKTATAYVAPTGLGNTGNVNVASQTSTSTNKVDYGNAATSTKSSSGAGATQETNSIGAKETGKGDARKAAGVKQMGGLQERVLAVALGLVMVL